MIPFNEYLVRIGACKSARIWVGDKTAERAWLECRRGDWMLYLLRRLSPNNRRLRLAAADFAERAWSHIDDEPGKLSAAWAIGAARRGDPEEMAAASSASAAAAAYAATYAATYASSAAAAAASAAPADASADAATYASSAAAAAASGASADASADASAAAAAEGAVQADILRKYFPAAEIARLVRAAIKAERESGS